MEKSDIISHFKDYVKELSSETRLGTYSIPRQGRKGLLVEGSGKSTRGNTPWKVAQYVIASTTDEDKEDITQRVLPYLDTWKNLMSGYGNQYLILEVSPGRWNMYDWNGLLMGDNDFISKYIPKKIKLIEEDNLYHNSVSSIHDTVSPGYLRAMRTKPFLLLAGISGTGKSRIVKQMAFDSCPQGELRKDPTSPGNYCLVEVKPNWHDSTELLGYESKIGKPHYVLTPFVRFLVKAMKHKEVPFFLCLDEMNLAPVEQYFAEFLSVLESRTKLPDGQIVSEPLIKPQIFADKDYARDLPKQLFVTNVEEEPGADGYSRVYSEQLSPEDLGIYNDLKEYGLRIPENVVVVGTVNMDETTHQFSRKVIDRAMTIEMNLPEGEPFKEFFENRSELVYRETPVPIDTYKATEVKASDVVRELAAADAERTEWLKGEVADFLTRLNEALEGTPFKVAYRVQNELMLYFYQVWREDRAADWETVLRESCDQIMMMKVLPRIEGDEELLEKVLNPQTGTLNLLVQPYNRSARKVAEMWNRLESSRFTSFWP